MLSARMWRVQTGAFIFGQTCPSKGPQHTAPSTQHTAAAAAARFSTRTGSTTHSTEHRAHSTEHPSSSSTKHSTEHSTEHTAPPKHRAGAAPSTQHQARARAPSAQQQQQQQQRGSRRERGSLSCALFATVSSENVLHNGSRRERAAPGPIDTFCDLVHHTHHVKVASGN